MNTKALKVITVNTLDEKLIKEWKELWERAENANMFNSYDFYLATKATMPAKEYHFYLCYQDDRLVAVLPMEEYKLFGIPTLGTINKPFLIDTGFLMESYDKAIFKALFDVVFTKKNVFMQKIDNKAATMLHELFPQVFLSVMSVNPMLPMNEDPFSNASPSTISQVKRLLRKYADHVEFKVYTDNMEEHFKTLLALQKLTTKHMKSMDVFEHGSYKEYYQNLLKYCKQHISIGFLYYDKKPIGYLYSVFWKDYFLGEQIAFHNDYRKISPGKLMVYLLGRYIKDNNYRVLDMGGGITPYKMSFANEYRVLYNAHYSSNMMVLSWWKFVNLTRRLKQTVLPQKFSRDHEFLFKSFAKNR